MSEELQKLKTAFHTSLEKINSTIELKELENEYLGKKGKLKEILAGVKDLSIEDKKTIGVAANEMKNQFISSIEKKAEEIEETYFAKIESEETIDVTI